jgi:hypothetical protein
MAVTTRSCVAPPFSATGGLVVLADGLEGTAAPPSHDHSMAPTVQPGFSVTMACTSRCPAALQALLSLNVMLGPNGEPAGHGVGMVGGHAVTDVVREMT